MFLDASTGVLYLPRLCRWMMVVVRTDPSITRGPDIFDPRPV